MKTYKLSGLIVIIALLITSFGVTQAHASSTPIDFENYASGSINYQGSGSTTTTVNGYTIPDPYGSLWTVADEWGFTTTNFDEEVQNDGTGNKVWRFSNAQTSNTYSDQPNSPSSPAVAGESTAYLYNDRGPDHTSPISPPNPRAAATTTYFHGGFRFKSATGAAQAGLSLAISPIPRQTSYRMSYIGISDVGTGFDLNFYETTPGGIFPETTIAEGLSYTNWHQIDIYVKFVDGLNGDGSGNDVVTILVDGIPVHTGTTWESYFAENPSSFPSPIAVDALLFRASGTAAPATNGNGFFFDDVVVDNTMAPVPDSEGPITTNVLASPNPAAVNSSVTVTANVDDSATGGSTIASAEYSLDGNNWSPMAASDESFNSVSEDVTATFNAPAPANIYNLCVRGKDAAGNTGASECIMFVAYDPSGGFVTGGGWIDSPAGAVAPIPTLVWNQGFEINTDGWLDSTNGWHGSITRVPSGTGGISSSNGSYYAMFGGDADSGPFTRFDGYRSVWPGIWTAEIDVYLDPAWSSGQGFDYSVAANGTDGEHQRDFIFHVTKDTSTGKLLVAGSNNTNFAPREDLENINHYEVTTAGWYTLQHVFRDQDGALAVDLNLLDANGNLLFTETRFNATDLIPQEVGGNRYGWFTFINVDGGIAVDENQLFIPVNPTGKATFGFVSKYKKGATVPDGNTEFQFKAGNLNFHSDNYDWLVINQDGANAQFKGSGTINGELAPNGNPYKFIIWAGDGSPDTFRIKIWYEDNGNEFVVYDNGSDQPIGGGSIVVHKK